MPHANRLFGHRGKIRAVQTRAQQKKKVRQTCEWVKGIKVKNNNNIERAHTKPYSPGKWEQLYINMVRMGANSLSLSDSTTLHLFILIETKRGKVKKGFAQKHPFNFICIFWPFYYFLDLYITFPAISLTLVVALSSLACLVAPLPL